MERIQFALKEGETLTLDLLLDKAGYTSQSFAVVMGVTEGCVRKWRKGASIMSSVHLAKACMILQIPAREMLLALKYITKEEYDLMPPDTEPMTITMTLHSVAKKNDFCSVRA